ncbi:MAG: response regulator transcription factor [Chloroflexota bacterium]|nr:response regulator transcription factor [Chloroflexota bacterium]
MDKISILIADDEPAFRSGLRALLKSADDLALIGDAATGDEVVRLAADLQPDIILMDINMPGVNGIEATRRVLTTSPHIGILMLTMFEDDDSVFAAMRAGARGYLLKGALKAEMLRAIQTVSGGGVVFGAAIAQRMMRYFTNLKPVEPAELFPELTEREREILSLIAQGHNNAEIAQRLTLSGKTIRNYITNIFSKLQVADRSQAIVRAREAGLGKAQR